MPESDQEYDQRLNNWTSDSAVGILKFIQYFKDSYFSPQSGNKTVVDVAMPDSESDQEYPSFKANRIEVHTRLY